ncbi:MAG: hypothetical protein CK532_06650 [Flavobacteriales bacterium]|nr:MAG: hypothetical protein CK532_06650 [Flavobacteriales bacterium]
MQCGFYSLPGIMLYWGFIIIYIQPIPNEVAIARGKCNSQKIICSLRSSSTRIGIASIAGIFFGVFANPVFAQQNWNPKDSIRMALQNKPSYALSFDSRNSYISAEPIQIFGIRGGLDYKKIALLIGYYRSKPFKEDKNNGIQSYRFNYVSATVDYKLYSSYRTNLIGFAQCGMGFNTIQHTNNTKQWQFFAPIEFGITGNLRFLRYFGIGAGTGTRIALFKGGRKFSGPIYTFGLTIFTTTLYKDVKGQFEK